MKELINKTDIFNKLTELIKEEYDERDETYNMGVYNCIEEIKEEIEEGKINYASWILCKEKLPNNTNMFPFDKQYLTTRGYKGSEQVLSYYNGWNCFCDFDGNINKENEIIDIIAWMEIPTYIMEEDV